MQVGLFIPCYIDQFYPTWAWRRSKCSSGRLHGRFSRRANLLRPADGEHRLHRRCGAAGQRFLEIFGDTNTSSAPSGSCVAMVRIITRNTCTAEPGFEELDAQDVRTVRVSGRRAAGRRIDGKFPHRVGLHQSCHGLRELRLGSSSEWSGRNSARRGSCSRCWKGSSSSSYTAGRVLRLRRHVRGGRRGGLVHDGAGSHSRSRAGRRRGA